MTETRTYRLSAPNDSSAPKIARDLLTTILTTADHVGLLDNARVCISDVVTNVLRHTTVPSLSMDVSVRVDRVIVGVHDSDPYGRPRARPASAEREGGRGLLIVQRLAHTWGVTRTGGIVPDGKRVWFELRSGCGAACAHLAASEGSW
jgi:hypothetical protein